jgi:outer membrane protein assembly factor BamB
MSAVPATEDRGQALRDAARAGDLEAVRALLEAGVPVDAPAERHGNTPLMFSAAKGHIDVVRLLLDRGAEVNARETFFGWTALDNALNGRHSAVARLLLERGAAGTVEALDAAIEQGDVELARSALAGRTLEPLELKAARKQAEAAGRQDLLDLLAGVQPQRRQSGPLALSAQQLQPFAARYRTGDSQEVTVAVAGDKLALSGLGESEMTFVPVRERHFETAAGDAALTFGGRAGLIEWATVNRDGDVVHLSLITSDPRPLTTAEAPADDSAPPGEVRPWPQFRGPLASGIADGQGVPVSWSVESGQNIRFKTALPGLALSSPIIWGPRIIVATAISAAEDRTFRTGLYGDGDSVEDLSEHSFRLFALDAASGEIVWNREVHKAQPTVRRHLKSSQANATPATDGQRIVALFGSVGVLAACDMSGEVLWKREIGVLDCNDPQSGTAEWGHASSPILYGDLVLIQADRRQESFAAAYRLDSGAEVWRASRDEASTWATPNVLRAESGDELIMNGRLIRAYEPRSGRPLWTLGPNSEVVVATPVVGDGRVFLTGGYPPVRPIYAVLAGQRGDLTLAEGQDHSSAVAWSHGRGGTYLPTPLLYRGQLYLLNNNGILACYDAASGRQLSQTRVAGGGASFSASPIAADGRILLTAETGEIYVLRAGPEPELLTTNAMGDVVMATPAASGGLLVVRTLSQVVGIGR